MKEPIYKIGDRVYHITPDSDQGVVLDCMYSMRANAWTYLVAFGPDKESLVYYEEELNSSKTYV